MLHLNVFRASVVALALGLSSPAGPACACSCLPTDPAEQVDKADVIFIGRVERVGPAGQIGDRPIGATIFRVERVLKGEAGTWVAVRHQSGDSTLCGMEFERNREHIVFARRSEGRLYAQACSRDWLPLERYEAELLPRPADQTEGRPLVSRISQNPAGHAPM